MTNDLAALRADYLYRYGDTHPVCALVDRVQAAEAALAACETMEQMLMQFVEEYGASSDPAVDQRAAERHFIAAVNHLGRI